MSAKVAPSPSSSPRGFAINRMEKRKDRKRESAVRINKHHGNKHIKASF